MTRIGHGQAGFTLLEVIVVLAVISALSAILTPVIFRTIGDADNARAQNNAATIATAVNRMYADTGRWPFYADGDGDTAHDSENDAMLLTSSATCTAGDCTDAKLPEDGTTGDTWGLSGTIIDSLNNQLVKNRPFDSGDADKDYAMTGKRAWRGPYVDLIPPTDPWDHSYVVNIGNANPVAPSPKWVIVISAGPDGVLQTNATETLTSNAQAVGDDIIARVR